MPTQKAIPCIFMRGGSSKGPYFRLSDLPADVDERAAVLLSVMGSPDPRQIDGIGGADALTSKVVMVAPSTRDDADVDYHFAQVVVDKAVVDTNPSCGNMLAGVGPFAIETGMVKATGPETTVRIFEVNTGSRIEAIVQTHAGAVIYEGDAEIAGVPGTSAPVRLNFMDIEGSKTDALLPTGHLVEQIDGIDVTLIDVSVSMMILRAADIGKTGLETAAELDSDTKFFARMEAMRLEAGKRMGLGDVTDKVVPKMAILAAPQVGGNIAARYFMPKRTHKAMAVTGGTCIAACAMLPGSVSDGLASRAEGDDRLVVVEHPTGTLEVALKTTGTDSDLHVESAGVIRTARKLMAGEVFVPEKTSK